jgi:hypothetical protein
LAAPFEAGVGFQEPFVKPAQATAAEVTQLLFNSLPGEDLEAGSFDGRAQGNALPG